MSELTNMLQLDMGVGGVGESISGMFTVDLVSNRCPAYTRSCSRPATCNDAESFSMSKHDR